MNDELEGFRPTRYFARSWALLTRESGWIKPVLVMFAALLVPIVGPLGVFGYIIEWARLTAWGVTSSPKQKNVKVGACIASGWRGFVVVLVWKIVLAIIRWVLEAIPLAGGLIERLWPLLSLFLDVVIMVAVLRAVIYQKIGAGLRVSTVWEMLKRDAGGLLRICGMWIIGSVAVGVIASIVSFIALAAAFPQLIDYIGYLRNYAAMDVLDPTGVGLWLFLSIISEVLRMLGPTLLVVCLVIGLGGIIVSMLCYTATGLWMRQFDVPHWRGEADPLPGTAAPQGASGSQAGAAPDYQQGSWQAPQGAAPQPGTAPQSGPAPAPSAQPAQPDAPASGGLPSASDSHDDNYVDPFNAGDPNE